MLDGGSSLSEWRRLTGVPVWQEDDEEDREGDGSTDTANMYEVMKLIRNDSGVKRKVAATGAKKFVMKIWAPRKGEMTLYKAKQQIAKHF